MPFTNKNVIITGGTSGIGLSLAILMAKNGANLLLLSRNAESASDVETKIHEAMKLDHQLLILKNLDLSKRPIEPAIEKEILAFNVDILVNNAGVVVAKTFSEQSIEELLQQLDTNLIGTILITKLCLPILQTKQSQIVFINSLAGLIALYGYTGYSTSKFGLEGFSRSLAQEFSGSKIHVCSVYPPDTSTPQLSEEKKTRPSKLNALNSGKPLPVDFVAHEILKGMIKKKSKIFPGFAAKIQGYFILYFSEIVYKYFHWILRRS